MIVPAFLEGDFSAISFLLLAATRFRSTQHERNTLTAMEATEMVRRAGYIEELPGYLRPQLPGHLVALSVAVTSQIFDPNRPYSRRGLVVALFLVLNRLMQGRHGRIAHVELVDLGFEGPS